jgi:hypothetical protein
MIDCFQAYKTIVISNLTTKKQQLDILMLYPHSDMFPILQLLLTSLLVWYTRSSPISQGCGDLGVVAWWHVEKPWLP